MQTNKKKLILKILIPEFLESVFGRQGSIHLSKKSIFVIEKHIFTDSICYKMAKIHVFKSNTLSSLEKICKALKPESL